MMNWYLDCATGGCHSYVEHCNANSLSSPASAVSSATSQYRCQICLRSFSSYARKSQHESYHYGYPGIIKQLSTRSFRVQIAPKKFHCCKCDRMFFTVHSKTQHQKRHFFSACASGMVCWSRTVLLKKVVSRRSPHLHACETCGKMFRYRPCLLVHLRRHGNAPSELKVWYT